MFWLVLGEKKKTYLIMKSKLLLKTSVVVLSTIIFLGTALAQPNPPAPPSGQAFSIVIDPATGLPLPPATPWKDPNWKDPDKVLPEVSYDGLPVREVARNLTDLFKDEFDVLLPQDWEGGTGSEGHDWPATRVHLRLKNVTVSEVFNAMNLVFENNRTPLRWELKLNGCRPVALLRVLEEPIPRNAPGSPQRPWRKIFFVGDLIGEEKSGGMTMDQIFETVYVVYQMSYGLPPGSIKVHKDAQLLIVTATADQVDLIEQTLAALKRKVDLGRAR